MSSFGVLMGMLAALALLAAGLLLLPEPGFDTAAGFFTALWLLVAFFAAAAFGREALRREKLSRHRKNWRRKGRRLPARMPAGRVPLQSEGDSIRLRGRRLD